MCRQWNSTNLFLSMLAQKKLFLAMPANERHPFHVV
jgi:hypothetical protein